MKSTNANNVITLKELNEFPHFDVGAAMVKTYYAKNRLYIGYYTNKETFAIVELRPSTFKVGDPNDEALHLHPLKEYGLTYHSVFQVDNSPMVAEVAGYFLHLEEMPEYAEKLRHLIFTSKDLTIEVVYWHNAEFGFVPSVVEVPEDEASMMWEEVVLRKQNSN